MSNKLITLDLNPDPRILRQFGYIALGGFGLLGAAAFFEKWLFSGGLGEARHPVAFALFGLAVLSAIFSLVAPKANKPIYVLLSVISYPIGFVMSYVIMGALFFGLFAPLAIMFRLAGRDTMARSYDRSAKSYWEAARTQPNNDRYFKQF
jgi:hypothetical protein